MNLKKVIWTILAGVMFVNVAVAQTQVVEGSDYKTSLHRLDMNLSTPTGVKCSHFIACYDSTRTSSSKMVFQVNSEGLISASGFSLPSDGVDNMYSSSYAMYWVNGDSVAIRNSGRGNTMFPVGFSFKRATFHNDVVVNGTLTCKDRMKVVEVDSKSIRAGEITVDMNNAADYVFDENYDLRSLSEVECFVKENKHLPGMPSAAELSEKGMSVSQMSNLLLEKVEELTLHLIDMKKEINSLKEENASLRSRLEGK
ncbi:MAG: hypothetical protein IK131_00810 [Paludibacteraceae bacterium]|nr:hypothetical protein [Paludibacteraceae bacterium]